MQKQFECFTRFGHPPPPPIPIPLLSSSMAAHLSSTEDHCWSVVRPGNLRGGGGVGGSPWHRPRRDGRGDTSSVCEGTKVSVGKTQSGLHVCITKTYAISMQRMPSGWLVFGQAEPRNALIK